MRWAAGVVASVLALGACAPPAGEPSAATADEALTSAQLEGVRWEGATGSPIAWLEVTRDPSRGLVYRAGRRAPFRNEGGTVGLCGSDLALVRGHVTERFTASVRADTLTLAAGSTKLTLRKATAAPPAEALVRAPFSPRSAVRASNGKIYATSPNVAGVTRFAAYDPDARTWTELPAVPTLLEDPPMVAGEDGRIYLVGGNDSSILRNVTGAAPFVHAFDTRTDFWIDMPPLAPLDARAFGAAALCPGGRIALVGGMRFNGFGISMPTTSYYRKPLLYDVRTGRTSYGADSGIAIVNPTVASSAQGIVYVVGGVSYGRGEVGHDTPTSNSTSYAMAYDCARDTWKTLPLMPTARVDARALVDERGRLWVVGGQDGGGAYKPVEYRTVELYDPATNAWTTLPEGITAYRPSLVPGDGTFWRVAADGVAPLARIGGG